MIFKLAAPIYLLLILFVPIFGFIGWRLWASRKSPLVWSWLRRFGMVVLILLIALRPSFPGGSAPQGMTNFDVYFVVDTTSSMAAEDYNGTRPRLDGVRQDIKDITAQMAGARFSMLTFNSDTYVELPLTTDTSAVNSIGSTLQQEITYYSKGSTISQPVEKLKTELSRSRDTRLDRQAIVYFMSDGEQTSNEKIGSFTPLKPFISGGAVLGYGTTNGAKMKEFTGFQSTDIVPGYIKDYSGDIGTDAVSKLDESNLRSIADQTGMAYVHRTEPGNIASVATQVGIAKLQSDHVDTDTYNDMYWLLAVLLALVVAWEAWTLRSTLRDVRTKRMTT